MKIVENEKNNWLEIRENLNHEYFYDENWEKAINLFEKRLMLKFFNPIQEIINKEIIKGEGFTILTVQCALIEMFASFKNGKIFNHQKDSNSPKYEYKESKKMFVNLLRTAAIFKDNFWELNNKNKVVIDKPYNPNDFYKNVRCALMHEARTKENWHVNATKKTIKSELKFIETEDGKIKIFRSILHYKLLDYLNEYCNDLRMNSIDSKLLRKYFARKLDSLYEISSNENYDWWSEE